MIPGCVNGNCAVPTYSTSMIPYTTATVLVPVPGATVTYTPKSGSVPATTVCNWQGGWPQSLFSAGTPPYGGSTESPAPASGISYAETSVSLGPPTTTGSPSSDSSGTPPSASSISPAQFKGVASGLDLGIAGFVPVYFVAFVVALI